MRFSISINDLLRHLRPRPALVGATSVPESRPLPPVGARPERPWRRVPIALARSLGAACPLCDGAGCESCAHTGLG